MDGLGERRFRTLSTGQARRVLLARALAGAPALLLLDEPFSALDYQTRLNVSDDIGKILKKQRKPAILVTHDISEAISLGDRVLVLSARPGRILQDLPMDFGADRTPLSVRSLPAFQTYFQEIWQAMTQEGGENHA